MKNKNTIKGFKIGLSIFLLFQGALLIVAIVSLVMISTSNIEPAKKKDNVLKSIRTNSALSFPRHGIMLQLSNPNLDKYYPKIKKGFQMFLRYHAICTFIALILITILLLQIFKNFEFNLSNYKRIRMISFVVILWVIADFLLRLWPHTFIHPYALGSSIGLTSFKHGFFVGLLGINFNVLITAGIIFVLSLVYKYTYELKNESALTI